MIAENQPVNISINPRTLDVAVYPGKTTWVVVMILTKVSPGGGLEFQQELVSIDNDGGTEHDARGQAIMYAMNKRPGYQLATAGCIRLTAVPADS